MGNLRTKHQMGHKCIPFSLTFYYPDLYHMHENSVDGLGPEYSIIHLHKNIKI